VTPLVLFAASWLLAQPVSAPATPRGTIAVTVSGVRHAGGSLRVKLVGSGEGFPSSEAHVVAKRRIAADGPGARFDFEDVPYGEYAVVCLHDADDDSELDRGPLGLPAEGLGFSSGARIRFGPPDFEEARFVLGTPELSIGIELRYGWERGESR
jgi:uncharacterized protein (DUF2141 family)